MQFTPRGSRPSSGGRDGGRLLDPAAEGVDVVPQQGALVVDDHQGYQVEVEEQGDDFLLRIKK